MTPERVIEVVEKYERELSDDAISTRWEASNGDHTEDNRRDHILWMCGETRKHVEAGKMDKAMRWLGFIQGVMWADFRMTIAEMKDDNR